MGRDAFHVMGIPPHVFSVVLAGHGPKALVFFVMDLFYGGQHVQVGSLALRGIDASSVWVSMFIHQTIVWGDRGLGTSVAGAVGCGNRRNRGRRISSLANHQGVKTNGIPAKDLGGDRGRALAAAYP